MDGETEPEESLVDKLTQVEKMLDEYEEKIHLNINPIEPDLNVNKDYMEAMDWEDVQDLAFSYAQYSLFLQKELNKHQTRHNWAEANLKRYIERESRNYDHWKWEARLADALSDSSYAQKLHSLKIKSKLVIDRLAFLPSKIQFLSELARDIMKAKRYRHVEQD